VTVSASALASTGSSARHQRRRGSPAACPPTASVNPRASTASRSTRPGAMRSKMKRATFARRSDSSRLYSAAAGSSSELAWPTTRSVPFASLLSSASRYAGSASTGSAPPVQPDEGGSSTASLVFVLSGLRDHCSSSASDTFGGWSKWK
jgi:hypothetical protein